MRQYIPLLKILSFLILLSSSPFHLFADPILPKILIFHKTNGFRHSGAITKGIELVESLGAAMNWEVINTQDASVFTAAQLADIDLVIWMNTSGNGLLNVDQRSAFEDYMFGSGAFMGIHAATDTYRDKTWPFYNELVGAIVQTGPNHTANNFNATMDVLEVTHESVSHLGLTWKKNEEYYYWELNGGQLSNDNTNLLMVESTGSNSYDAARPIAWYKTSIELDGERKPVRSFYTALGHNGSDYENNADFISHIEGAILWLICKGEKKVWDGTNWNTTGTPTFDNSVFIDGVYDTSVHGPINACSVTVREGGSLVVGNNNAVTTTK